MMMEVYKLKLYSYQLDFCDTVIMCLKEEYELIDGIGKIIML